MIRCTADNEIEMFCHCGMCIQEIQAGVAGEESPQSYAQLDVGWTTFGLQVWCRRHGVNVLNIDFEGCQHPAIVSAKLES